MARFRCRECGAEGEFEYRPGVRDCPRCGARDVQTAVSIMEIPDDDPMWEQLRKVGDRPMKAAPARSGRKRKS